MRGELLQVIFGILTGCLIAAGVAGAINVVVMVDHESTGREANCVAHGGNPVWIRGNMFCFAPGTLLKEK